MRKSEELEKYMNLFMHELCLENYDELFIMLHSSLMLSKDIMPFTSDDKRESFLDMMTYIALHHPSRRTLVLIQQMKVKFTRRRNENDMEKWWEQQKKDLN